MGVLKPDLIMKSVIPVVMAGILGIYGMIVAVILQGKGESSYLSKSLDRNPPKKVMLSWQQASAVALVHWYAFQPSKERRISHRNRGRCGSASKRAAGQNFRRHDPDSDFCGSPGLVRTHRFIDIVSDISMMNNIINIS